MDADGDADTRSKRHKILHPVKGEHARSTGVVSWAAAAPASKVCAALGGSLPPGLTTCSKIDNHHARPAEALRHSDTQFWEFFFEHDISYYDTHE